MRKLPKKKPLFSFSLLALSALSVGSSQAADGRYDGRDFVLNGQSSIRPLSLQGELEDGGSLADARRSLADLARRVHRESRWHFQDGVGLMGELRTLSLTLKETGDKMRLLRTEKIGGGAGYGLGASIGGSLLPVGLPAAVVPFVGVIPIVGAAKTTERVVSVTSLQEAKKLPDISIPYKVDEMAAWTVGDRMNLSANGGLLTLAGAGSFGAYAAGTLLIQGEWTLNLEKFEGDVVKLDWTRETVKSAGLIQGVGFVSISEQAVRSTATHFSYLMDLADPEARTAFEAAMRGQIVTLQELVDRKSAAALALGDREEKFRARLYSYGFSLPFLRWSSGRTRALSEDIERRFTDGTKVSGHQGVTLWSTESSMFGSYRHFDEAFLVRDWTATRDGKSESATVAAFRMSFQKNKAQRSDLEGALLHVAQKTGLTSETRVSSADLPNEIGDLDIQLLLEWGPRAFADFEARTASASERDEIGRVAVDFAESYLASLTQELLPPTAVPGGRKPHQGIRTPEWRIEGDVLGICEDSNGIANCRKSRLAEIRKIMDRMGGESAKARKAQAEGRREDRVAAITTIGKDVARNPFVFQALHRLVQSTLAVGESDLRARLDVRAGRLERVLQGY